MQRRENLLYVGIDLHKETHTAVMVNCWNEKLEVVVIENKPSEFKKLAEKVNRKSSILGLNPIYGLENAYGYGRSLAVWLIENGYIVKDINPALAYDKRKSAPMYRKNDEYDAYCVGTVLINQLHTLPDAKPKDNEWTLAQLVNRRDLLVKGGIRFKNGLHEQISMAYPSYSKFFSEIDGKCAMYFWKTYPSPVHLREKTAEELTMEFKEMSLIIRKDKAELILDCIHNDGDTFREYQESRDFITISLVRDLEHQKEELAGLDKEIEKILLSFDYKLTSMPGIGTSIASKLIAEIGDIRRFSNADKLARFAGVAPVKFSSAGKGKEQSSRQGKSSVTWTYFLMITMVSRPKNGAPNHPVFYDYYMRKIGEGKTKSQALVCIMRRLVNIVYGMNDLLKLDFVETYSTSSLFKGNVFKNTNFGGAELYDCIFKDIVFENCNLGKTIFNYAVLTNSKFSNCNLINLETVETQFEELSFKNCVVNSAFSNCIVKNVIFEECSFVSTEFWQCIIESLRFSSIKKELDLTKLIKEINIGTIERPTFINGDRAVEYFKSKCIMYQI